MDTGALRVKGQDIARALKVVSKGTGHRFTMRTKTGRFDIQKTVYLLKQLVYPPAESFDYSIYLNGPYSPELAQVSNALEGEGNGRVTPAVLPAESIRLISACLDRGAEFLEALTTVLDGVNRGRSCSDASDWAKLIKPHLSATTWRGVGRFLAAHPGLARRT
jgi:hypothetical protein